MKKRFLCALLSITLLLGNGVTAFSNEVSPPEGGVIAAEKVEDVEDVKTEATNETITETEETETEEKNVSKETEVDRHWYVES